MHRGRETVAAGARCRLGVGGRGLPEPASPWRPSKAPAVTVEEIAGHPSSTG